VSYVADGVEIAVDAEVEVADRAGLTRGDDSAVDDLVRCGDDLVDRSELEGGHGGLGALALPVVPGWGRGGGGEGAESHNGGCDGEGLHDDGWVV